MILGSYHFANPGLDAKNVEADDVMTPRRQAELEALAAKLARYKPTKIMVESPQDDNGTRRNYRNFRAGKYQLTHNETDQIGFRLAERLGHAAIYSVDFPMRMSGLRPDELDDNWRPKPIAAPTAPAAALSGSPAKPREFTDEEKLLRASTITQTLIRMNNPNSAEEKHLSYTQFLMPEDSPAIYAQSDYLVNWYKRNIRIMANVTRETKFPEDNILVLVGSGHLKIMRGLARDAPFFCLVEPNVYLGS